MNLVQETARIIDQRHPNLWNQPWTTTELVRLVLTTALEVHDRPAQDPADLPVRLVPSEEL